MDSDLNRLAAAHGVATWYEDGNRRRVDVTEDVVRGVLGCLGVPAEDGPQVRAALAELDAGPAAALPPTIVLREGDDRELGVTGTLYTEDGQWRAVSGRLPADLPLGWHLLDTEARQVTVIVAPRGLPQPPAAWGWAVQLYALHSPGSWGMGDLADLRDFASATGRELAADAVLVNPLHAITPAHPVEPSPYSPSSRRFVNPLYLRITETQAYRDADAATRSTVDELAPKRPSDLDTIDYDEVWQAKRTALELLAGDPAELDADPELRAFGMFCALAERHGPSWRDWPAELQHPDGEAVAEQASELDSRVRFHEWLQRLCQEQLAEAQQGAQRAGMRIGVLTDLAVGIAPGGADSWALQDVLAQRVTIGAPPDAFNQRGQNWSLTPWHPRELAEAGYRPFREMLRAQLRHAGGLRIDHVAGLWRLWWIPEGDGPDRGTYVYYDAEALLAVLALEAHRAGAIVLGEDLGTVPDEVSEALREQHMLGCAVAWFQRGEPDAAGVEPLLPPARWPERAAATISTHDLPTAAGFLTGEHVRVRAELDQLSGEVAQEWADAAAERAELVDLLRAEGLLTGAEPGRDEIITAMHAMLARTPCRLLLASPYDVIGETRQPNLPGTVDEYPNWRLPLPLSVAEFVADDRVHRMAAPLRAARPRP